MKNSFVAAALLAGLVGPASAATVIDFTTAGIDANDPNPVGQIFTLSAVGGNLVDVSHGNVNGCVGQGWNFACTGKDVGLGVSGGANNEIDTNQYVVVTFDYAVKILGFAGMLTYGDAQSDGTESVVLEFWNGAAWVVAGIANAIFEENVNGSFGTVGLAFRNNLSIDTTAVRFTSGGAGDQGDSNVTAAGLIIAPVPIPASLPLLLAGLGALGFAARRKRKSA